MNKHTQLPNVSPPEQGGAAAGPGKHALLSALAERYGCPWVEYSEKVNAPVPLLWQFDLAKLKAEGWFPLSVTDRKAVVIATAPGPELAAEVKAMTGVEEVAFQVTLPADLIRIFEHNQDVNPRFPPTAGRTPLARVRTYLAGRRSAYAHYRTLLAKSRTGLAFIRTGLSFITIALLFLRILGGGFLLLLEMPLLVAGIVMVYDGLKWYLPARKIQAMPECVPTQPTNGTSVLEVYNQEATPLFKRTGEMPGAAELREGWTSLSPVMRRRYLASDRTDLAEERTVLACLRTRMAKARTGLAFTRTGLAFFSLGLGLIRQFHASSWLPFDLGLVGVGGLMAFEGFLWYFNGRQAGVVGHETVTANSAKTTVWDFFFPHKHPMPGVMKNPVHLPVRRWHAPGIWATTGVALERTVLAERRNVMARLRTVMARGRTGMAFIRTGMSILLIGIAFLVNFELGGWYWNLFAFTMIGLGLYLLLDGCVWTLPAEWQRRQYPYCFGSMEITIPFYGTPPRYWKKAVFSNEKE
ncbi:MAG: hypothetical protein M0017_01135 [Desulfobacteraceae bacterium]|nr:hypothetical protein [Desulfobacteraceae bacterium]